MNHFAVMISSINKYAPVSPLSLHPAHHCAAEQRVHATVGVRLEVLPDMRQRELPHPFRVENDEELVDEVGGDLLDVGVHGDEHTGGEEVEEVVSRHPTVHVAVIYLQAIRG